MPDIEVGFDNATPQVDDLSPMPEDAPEAALVNGTTLEAAFVDPAYPWPPVDGQGKNAIELQAAMNDDSDDATTDSTKASMQMPKKPVGMKKRFGWCGSKKNADDAVISDYEQQKKAAQQARLDYKARKKEKEKDKRKSSRYTRVPEGILIYRLDTATRTLKLMSPPHANTNMDTLVEEMVIQSSKPSADMSRRGIDLKGDSGKTTTLVACEQRTAIAWLEATDMMLANKQRKNGKKVCCGRVCVMLYLSFSSFISHFVLSAQVQAIWWLG